MTEQVEINHPRSAIRCVCGGGLFVMRPPGKPTSSRAHDFSAMCTIILCENGFGPILRLFRSEEKEANKWRSFLFVEDDVLWDGVRSKVSFGNGG